MGGNWHAHSGSGTHTAVQSAQGQIYGEQNKVMYSPATSSSRSRLLRYPDSLRRQGERKGLEQTAEYTNPTFPLAANIPPEIQIASAQDMGGEMAQEKRYDPLRDEQILTYLQDRDRRLWEEYGVAVGGDMLYRAASSCESSSSEFSRLFESSVASNTFQELVADADVSERREAVAELRAMLEEHEAYMQKHFIHVDPEESFLHSSSSELSGEPSLPAEDAPVAVQPYKQPRRLGRGISLSLAYARAVEEEAFITAENVSVLSEVETVQTTPQTPVLQLQPCRLAKHVRLPQFLHAEFGPGGATEVDIASPARSEEHMEESSWGEFFSGSEYEVVSEKSQISCVSEDDESDDCFFDCVDSPPTKPCASLVDESAVEVSLPLELPTQEVRIPGSFPEEVFPEETQTTKKSSWWRVGLGLSAAVALGSFAWSFC